MRGHAHRDAHHQVENGDQKAGDGVPLHELGCAVERAEEGRLFLFDPAALFRLLMGDGASGEVAVDRELLARHGVEGEAGANLGHPACALGDDDEVDDQQNEEDDEAEKQVPAHHEHREALDHAAGGVEAAMTFADDEFGRRDVEREAQHQRSQQHRREGREVERPFNEQGRREDQDRHRERSRKADVENERRHRQDHHDDDGHQRQREQHSRLIELFD